MPTEIYFVAAMIATYLAGSVSTALIVCKLLTLPDPRETGSHNPGATNVRRIGGNKAAFLT
ncbi:MAG: glycerol-3-phosphate acyltransferase, partial [Phototrophicales bacterium]